MRVGPQGRTNDRIREKKNIKTLPTLCEDTGRLVIYEPGKLTMVWTRQTGSLGTVL